MNKSIVCGWIYVRAFIISKDKSEDTKLIYRELNRQNNHNKIIAGEEIRCVVLLFSFPRLCISTWEKAKKKKKIYLPHICLIVIEIEKWTQEEPDERKRKREKTQTEASSITKSLLRRPSLQFDGALPIDWLWSINNRLFCLRQQVLFFSSLIIHL